MKKIFAVLIAMLMLGSFLSGAIADEDSEEITLTVTYEEEVGISLSETEIDYGDVPTGCAMTGNITATNTGNMAEDFYIKGSDARRIEPNSYGIWWLSDEVGVNRFVHKYHGVDTTDLKLTKMLQVAEEDVSEGEEVDFTLEICVPTSCSRQGKYETTVTIVAMKA